MRLRICNDHEDMAKNTEQGERMVVEMEYSDEKPLGYQDTIFYDDLTGKSLEEVNAREARREETRCQPRTKGGERETCGLTLLRFLHVIFASMIINYDAFC